MRSDLLASFLLLVVSPLAILLAHFVSAQEPAGKEGAKKEKERGYVLGVIGANGKETTFKKWKVLQGTRKVGEAADKDDVRPPAQEYLEFREDNSTTYKDGILTLVPMTSLQQVDYDEAKRTVAAAVLDAGGKKVVLTGTTKFVGLNKLSIDVEFEVGELGTTNLKLQGGMTNVTPAIGGYRFPSAQPAPKVSGPTSVIVAGEKDKTVFKVQDLRALYRFKESDRISPYLLFKKDVKVDVSKIVKLRKAPAENKKQAPIDYEVTQADGKENMILVTTVFPDNGQPGQFLGLIGRVPAGYKLFPLHLVSEMRKEE